MGEEKYYQIRIKGKNYVFVTKSKDIKKAVHQAIFRLIHEFKKIPIYSTTIIVKEISVDGEKFIGAWIWKRGKLKFVETP